MSRASTIIVATRSTWWPAAPAASATERACSAMWPRWMPSVASARTAARFDARPTRRGDAGELLRVGDAEHPQRQPRRRVDPERPADGAERQRQLERHR